MWMNEEILLTIADAFLGLPPRCPSLVPFGCILFEGPMDLQLGRVGTGNFVCAHCGFLCSCGTELVDPSRDEWYS